MGLVNDQTSDYYTDDRETQQLILDDADEYRSARAFVVPPKARWSYLLTNAQADDIKVNLDEALEGAGQSLPEKLSGLLPRVYAGSNLSRENVTGLSPQHFGFRSGDLPVGL